MPVKIRVISRFAYVFIFILGLSCLSFSEEKREAGPDRFTGLLTSQEIADMRAGLSAWTDDAMLEVFRGKSLTEDDLKGLYRDLSVVLAGFPRSGQKGELKIEDPAALEVKAESLGKKNHNLFLAMTDEDFEKYGKFLGIVRETLFFDASCMKKFAGGDKEILRRWAEIHATGVKEAEREYLRLAIAAWGVESQETENDAENSIGTASLPDGSVYEGGFDNGLFNGRGTRTWKDGHKYEGGYKDGFPHGMGVETWSDGMRYEGGFRDGEWYGKGVVTWKDGRRYEVENY